MGRRDTVGDATAHVLPAAPANHFELLRLVDGASNEKVDPFAAHIAGFAADVLRGVPHALETAFLFHRLDGFLALFAKGLLIQDDRRRRHCRSDRSHRVVVAINILKQLLLLRTGLSFRIAALAARCDVVPIAFPFFPPRKGPVADHTDLRGQIFLGNSFPLFVLHSKASRRGIRAIENHSGSLVVVRVR